MSEQGRSRAACTPGPLGAEVTLSQGLTEPVVTPRTLSGAEALSNSFVSPAKGRGEMENWGNKEALNLDVFTLCVTSVLLSLRYRVSAGENVSSASLLDPQRPGEGLAGPQ